MSTVTEMTLHDVQQRIAKGKEVIARLESEHAAAGYPGTGDLAERLARAYERIANLFEIEEQLACGVVEQPPAKPRVKRVML